MAKLGTADEVWRVDEAVARWIFPLRPEDTVNQVVDFLQDVTCDASERGAELLISADTDFVVWLNGELIGHGQYCNYPDRKTYERFPLRDALHKGVNRLAITVFYNGRTSSVYRRGDPGLIFEVRGDGLIAASGMTTLCRSNPCYQSGPIAVVSGQLAYTFGYDARGDDGFNRDGYVPGDDWTAITEAEARLPKERVVLTPRPVPRLIDGGHTAVRLAAVGLFRREPPEDPSVSPAWLMQHDHLSEGSAEAMTGVTAGTELDDLPEGLSVSVSDLGKNDGIMIRFDLGQEEAGYLDLDIEAAAGTIMDMGYGEHLDDGQVRSFVGGRSFGARYVCREGRQRFTHHFLRWAGRYLEIHVQAKAITIHRFSLQRREYPVELRGKLSTGKPLHNRLLAVGRRTLHLCMHEHYEDTPWREQALYANDARTQALCGYYAFGETAMPAASFTLLGQGLRDDGYLMLCAPAAPGVTIPSFTLVWMLAVRDHYLYSGDDSVARAFLPQMLTMLRGYLGELKDGLWPLRRARGIWHFYDWSAGMSGYDEDDFAKGLDADAPLNCFLILALEAVQQMLAWCGEPGGEELATAADGLRQAVAKRFWDPQEGVFRTHAHAKILTELTQALAVLAGAGDSKMRESVLERMARGNSGLAGPGLSQAFYTFAALMTDKKRYGLGVLAGIESIWGKMLDAGATTFWETINGASDFSNAGSLCHGWSAAPIYVLYHDLLGVCPLEPGFRQFSVDPMSAAADRCTGRVPVPGGVIDVTWKHDAGKMQLKVDAPAHTTQMSCDAK